MTQSAPIRRIGLLGGSFNPVHVGHLALGQAAISALTLDELVLMPAGYAWQKPAAEQISGEHRLAMLALAVAALPANRQAAHWHIDDLEVRRRGPSYTIDTLLELRQIGGRNPALILIMGSDQFRRLDQWHRWEELLEHAHIAVTQRETVPLSGLPPAIEQLLQERGADALPNTPAGRIVFFRMPPVPVSSTRLRQQLASGQPVDGLLPLGVEAYIRRHGLYGTH